MAMPSDELLRRAQREYEAARRRWACAHALPVAVVGALAAWLSPSDPPLAALAPLVATATLAAWAACYVGQDAEAGVLPGAAVGALVFTLSTFGLGLALPLALVAGAGAALGLFRAGRGNWPAFLVTVLAVAAPLALLATEHFEALVLVAATAAVALEVALWRRAARVTRGAGRA